MRSNSAFAFIQILLLFAWAESKNASEYDSMVLKSNSVAFSKWQRPTAQRLMKVHLFNYTNWQRVRDGMDTKFHVEDVGPYVYSQQLERVNVKFDGDLLTFQENNNFEFLSEDSVGAPLDEVFVPNIPFLTVVSRITSFFIQVAVNVSLNTVGYDKDPFLHLPVQGFLWGYEDVLIPIIKPLLNMQNVQTNFDKYGLLVTSNGTSSDTFTINTGERDIKRINIIEEFNGRKSLSFWGSPECDSVEASHGSYLFPPSLLDRNQTLEVFFPNLCRKIPFKYVKDVEMDGVNLLRYEMPRDVFDDPARNPANQCYCQVDTGTCPPRGVLNLTACSMNALVSLPHFHLGDPALREHFTGLHSDDNTLAEQYQSYLDIHPTLGVVLRGKFYLQLNIKVKKFKSYDYFEYLPDGLILPIAWIEMSVEDLQDNLQILQSEGNPPGKGETP